VGYLKDITKGKGRMKVEKYKARKGETEDQLLKRIGNGATPYATFRFENEWLLVGWNELLKVWSGQSADVFNNKTLIGVGDSEEEANENQTDLLGANTCYKAQETLYPTVPTSGTIQYRSRFLFAEANFTWAEVVIKHPISGICWNRGVSAIGVKTNVEIWYLTVTIGKA
jgi:hypothetical protein